MAQENASILVVDDSLDTLEVIRRNLESQGHRVYTAPGVAEALEVLGKRPVDLVITDLKMPKIGGLDLVRHVRENLPTTEVMMITGYATIDSAVKAVKAGAEEYLAKPFTDEELFAAVRRTLDKRRERRAARLDPERGPAGTYGLIGDSPAIQEVYRAIAKAAKTNATVFIAGESGVGKELVAKAIHAHGPRAGAPFVRIHCGAIPEELFESELFGHVKGAFNGATASKEGRFMSADGGTLFLDEISDMSRRMQVKLLRVLQDGELWRVGSTEPTPVDVRVLTASSEDLPSLVKAGIVREDVFLRLSVIAIAVPALRHRGDDVVLLAAHFASQFAHQEGRPAPRFSDRALSALKSYHWPGNIRELENLMNQLVVMCDTEVLDVTDLPKIMRYTISDETAPTRTLAEMEAEYVQKVVDSTGGNKTKAAKILGIDRKTLREKLKSGR